MNEWRDVMINLSNSRALSEEMIDRILADSFPASDPPPWTVGRENEYPRSIGDTKNTMRTQRSKLDRRISGERSAKST